MRPHPSSARVKGSLAYAPIDPGRATRSGGPRVAAPLILSSRPPQRSTASSGVALMWPAHTNARTDSVPLRPDTERATIRPVGCVTSGRARHSPMQAAGPLTGPDVFFTLALRPTAPLQRCSSQASQ